MHSWPVSRELRDPSKLSSWCHMFQIVNMCAIRAFEIRKRQLINHLDTWFIQLFPARPIPVAPSPLQWPPLTCLSSRRPSCAELTQASRAWEKFKVGLVSDYPNRRRDQLDNRTLDANCFLAGMTKIDNHPLTPPSLFSSLPLNNLKPIMNDHHYERLYQYSITSRRCSTVIISGS